MTGWPISPAMPKRAQMVEVQFKNTRKGFYRNSNKIKLEKGDVIAVEATPGHDIGVVTLTGRLVPLQMKKANVQTGYGNQTHLPKGQTGRHGKVRRSESQRTYYHDSCKTNCNGLGAEYEDRRRGVSRGW